MTYLDRNAHCADEFRLSLEHDGAGAPPLRRITSYDNLRTEADTANATWWCTMRPQDRPSYTIPLLNDLSRMRQDFARNFQHGGDAGLRWFVMDSATPGVFNLGGDLSHFARRIESGDQGALRAYGHLAIDNIYANSIAFGLPVVTIALIQGDALGGGFEHALSSDVIVAERNAKLGFPEVLFNLFPGMGAYSFLDRKVGRATAEKLILSGQIYTAEALHAMGVIDVLAEDGAGRETVQRYIAAADRKHNAHHAVYRTRRRVHPVSEQELRDVVDIWAETAMGLTRADLRKMERLASAQLRRLDGLEETRSALKAHAR